MHDEIRVERVNNNSSLHQVHAIRTKVFVEEQSCPPELEWEFEEDSVHFLCTMNGLPVGAARWRRTEQGIKLERFAVLKEYRNRGAGAALVQAVLGAIPSDATSIYLHAQLQAMHLYQRFGFSQEGDEFEEAGIRHYKMVLR